MSGSDSKVRTGSSTSRWLGVGGCDWSRSPRPAERGRRRRNGDDIAGAVAFVNNSVGDHPGS